MRGLPVVRFFALTSVHAGPSEGFGLFGWGRYAGNGGLNFDAIVLRRELHRQGVGATSLKSKQSFASGRLRRFCAVRIVVG